ncbi:MAG: hypothetical protein L6R39_005379 [Caloplaca ligustica]|nr:MAG: hypothetical protein L6R39_005379 [Caloplaca ligustica]
MTTEDNKPHVSIPILLLKNKSTGHTDPYTTHFSSHPLSPNVTYQSIYVPVLEHTFRTEPVLRTFKPFFNNQDVEDATTLFPYGGLIFTSQRAVEAYAASLNQMTSIDKIGPTDKESLVQQSLARLAIPLYAVGPATALSLDKIRSNYLALCRIVGGEDAGSGETLAEVILKDYNTSYSGSAANEKKGQESSEVKKPLLFLTGAKHRDIIPLTLTSAPLDQKIDVEEMIVYASTESVSFASNLTTALDAAVKAPIHWVVVFSPTGVDTLFQTLGWLDDNLVLTIGQDNPSWASRKTFVASIGPTTRDYMKNQFGFEVDVCAAKPSPEGVRQGIEDFMRKHGGLP